MEAKTAQRPTLLRSDTLQRFLAFGGLIALVVVFSLASPFFMTPDNIGGILLATAVNGVLALGVTFVIINGGIDLSVGTVMTFSAVMTAQVMIVWQQPVLVGILAGLATGAFCGLLNGLMVTKMKVPPFVATLGMLYATKGLSLVVSQLKPIYFNDAPIFNQTAMGSVLGSIVPALDPIKNVVLIMFGAAIIAAFILSKTILGRYTFAMGSNVEATRLSGVNVDRWQTAVYMLCGLFAGLAGVLIGARLNSAQPALGAGYELDAIAAAVIGGTSLSGGEGTILGTVIGAFVISVLANGLRILSVPQEWQIVVTGTILVLAVYMDRRRRK
ncbi:MAG: ABC transporter permease [Thermoflexales bacterium]|nr:ABC transporter permease [Thermoflexales bacterium]